MIGNDEPIQEREKAYGQNQPQILTECEPATACSEELAEELADEAGYEGESENEAADVLTDTDSEHEDLELDPAIHDYLFFEGVLYDCQYAGVRNLIAL